VSRGLHCILHTRVTKSRKDGTPPASTAALSASTYRLTVSSTEQVLYCTLILYVEQQKEVRGRSFSRDVRVQLVSPPLSATSYCTYSTERTVPVESTVSSPTALDYVKVGGDSSVSRRHSHYIDTTIY